MEDTWSQVLEYLTYQLGDTLTQMVDLKKGEDPQIMIIPQEVPLEEEAPGGGGPPEGGGPPGGGPR